MKRGISILTLILVFVLSGCSRVSTENYNALLSEKNELLLQNDRLTQEYTSVCEERDTLLKKANEPAENIQVNISGTFTATVRFTMQDYVSDTDPKMAVVTCFQSTPFTLYLGSDLISQVESGKTYVFEIEEKSIELTQEQYDMCPPDPESAIPLYGLRIKSILPAGEDDYGLDSGHIQYEMVK